MQVDFAGIDEVQVPPVALKSPGFDPLKAGGNVSATALVWKLCTVIALTFVDPIFVLVNMKLAGVTVISIVPVPERATCCGLVGVLSLTDSVALRAPKAPGVKRIAIVQVWPGASPPDGQVVAPVAANSGSFELTLPMSNGLILPVFLTVMFLVTVSPTGELPKASDAGTEMVVGGPPIA